MKKISILLIGAILFAAGCTKIANSPVGNNNLPINNNNQTATPDPTGSWMSYHVKSAFDVKYPSDKYKVSTGQSGYSNLNNKMVQLSTGKDRFPKTNFSDAAFTVSMQPTIDEQKCLGIQIPPNSKPFTTKEIINGVTFYSTTGNGAGAGNLYASKFYRTYKTGMCFEIAETIHTTNIGNYEPGTVTEVNPKPIWDELDLITNSVKF